MGAGVERKFEKVFNGFLGFEILLILNISNGLFVNLNKARPIGHEIGEGDDWTFRRT